MRAIVTACFVGLASCPPVLADACERYYFTPGCLMSRAIPLFVEAINLPKDHIHEAFLDVGTSPDGKPKVTELHTLLFQGDDEEWSISDLDGAEQQLAPLRNDYYELFRRETCVQSPTLNIPGVIEPPQLDRFVSAGGGGE